jgi:hypothetical protein
MSELRLGPPVASTFRLGVVLPGFLLVLKPSSCGRLLWNGFSKAALNPLDFWCFSARGNTCQTHATNGVGKCFMGVAVVDFGYPEDAGDPQCRPACEAQAKKPRRYSRISSTTRGGNLLGARLTGEEEDYCEVANAYS